MSQFNDLRPSKTNIILTVKQLLDERRLNASGVNIQSAPILLKLLTFISQLQASLQNNKNLTPNLNEVNMTDLLQRYLTAIHENNSLHLEIIKLKDQVYQLSAKLKDISNNILQKQQQSKNLLLLTQKNAKEIHLLEQLRYYIYKYNQLIDFLHENPDLQRQNIKRLLKHKHLNVQVQSPKIAPDRQPQNTLIRQDNYILALQARLEIRNEEIKRLHSKFSNFDKQMLSNPCPNQHLQNKIRLLEEEIDRYSLQTIHLNNKLGKSQKGDAKYIYNKFKSTKSLKSTPLFQKAIIRNTHNTFQQTTQNKSLSCKSRNILKVGSNKYKHINSKFDKPQELLQSLHGQKINQFPPSNQNVINQTTLNLPQIEHNKLKRLKTHQHTSTSPNSDFHYKEYSKNKSSFKFLPKNDQQLKKPNFSQKHADQQLFYFIKLLKQKDAKIQKLESLLKVIKTQKLSKQTKKTQTNNVIINQQHNEYITYNKSQPQLQKAFCEPTKLYHKIKQLKSRIPIYESNKQQKSSSNQNSQKILQEVRQRLLEVNKQNIDLQIELNQALQTIKQLRNKQSKAQKQFKVLNDKDIHFVLKQRDQLWIQIESLRKENLILRKQLSQTQKQLELQRIDMLDFQNTIKKKGKS